MPKTIIPNTAPNRPTITVNENATPLESNNEKIKAAANTPHNNLTNNSLTPRYWGTIGP